MRSQDITVVIPAHNAERYIVDAFNSVNAQTAKVHEIIVVINGCTDSTKERVEDYRKTSEIPIRVIETEFPSASNARNVGFSLATTPLIAMLDADDRFANDLIERAAHSFATYPNIALFFGNRHHFDDDGVFKTDFLETSRCNDIEPTEINGELRFYNFPIAEHLLDGSFISSSGSVLHKRKAFATGLFSTKYRHGEDRDFFIRLLLNNSSVGTYARVSDYRMYPESVTGSSSRSSRIRSGIRILEGMKHYPHTKPLLNKINVRLKESWREFFYFCIEENKPVLLSEVVLSKMSLKDKLFILSKALKNRALHLFQFATPS